MTFSTACSTPTPSGYCPPYFAMSGEVAGWFRDAKPPGYVWDYMHQIAAQQQAIAKNCKEAR